MISARMQTLLASASGAALLWCSTAPAAAQAVGDAGASAETEEIVVTGVVTGAQVMPSIAISVLKDAQLRAFAPVSTADLLRNVPGVFVNSALGEVRNIVYSRGVSANSAEAASGYYYVSLQEDGLPVTNVTATNYTPDFFLRQDLTIGRVEALRGGTAVVTGPNAPGGIFNYISRTGKSNPGFEIRARAGLLGDGRNPFYRGDAFLGGRIGNSDVYYSIGGFYRWDKGARDPGYAFNRGGQVKGNLLWDHGTGRVLLSAKLLDDRNGFFEFLPARNFENPRVISPLSNTDSFLPPATRYDYLPFAGGERRTYDSTGLTHSRSRSIGLLIEQEFGDGWQIENNARYTYNKVTYNTGAVIFPVPATDLALNNFLGTLGPGLYTFRDRQSGATLLQFNRAGFAFPPSVTVNNLPNQNVVGNGVLSQVAYDIEPIARELMNQFAITKQLDSMTFRVGAFFAHSSYSQFQGNAGIGVSPIVGNPQLLDVTVTDAGGVVRQVTSPEGYAGIGRTLGGVQSRLTQEQISLFGGHNWDITERLSSDVGIRYERLRVQGFTQQTTTAGIPQLPGGQDGNPLTLYDNILAGLTAPLRQDNRLDFVSWTGALTWRFDDRRSVFVRFSSGRKAPDIGFFNTLNTPGAVANLQPLAQKVEQLEGGLRLRTARLNLQLTPFWSRLSNVPSQQLFTNPDGSSYVPEPLFSELETIGIEVEANAQLTDSLNLNVAATFQDSKSRDFRTWVAGSPGPQDDRIAVVPDGEADNNPRVMSTTTLTFAPVERFSSFLSWRYLGARQANRFNTFKLPGFHQLDLGAAFQITDAIEINANVNNVLNGAGVMSWGPSGGLLASLDRQAFTPAQLAANPNQNLNIITIQPRAFFIGAGVKF